MKNKGKYVLNEILICSYQGSKKEIDERIKKQINFLQSRSENFTKIKNGYSLIIQPFSKGQCQIKQLTEIEKI